MLPPIYAFDVCLSATYMQQVMRPTIAEPVNILSYSYGFYEAREYHVPFHSGDEFYARDRRLFSLLTRDTTLRSIVLSPKSTTTPPSTAGLTYSIGRHVLDRDILMRPKEC